MTLPVVTIFDQWLAAETAIERTGLPRSAFHVTVTDDGRALVTSRVASPVRAAEAMRLLVAPDGVVEFSERAAA